MRTHVSAPSSPAGELTPGQLGAQLQLSSGGTTALIHRLHRAGHITRDAHPRDGRSAVVRLTPAMEESATEAWAPVVGELDALALELSERTLPPADSVAGSSDHGAGAWSPALARTITSP